MKSGRFKQALVVAGFGAFSSMASADFIATIEGNDCAGVFGQNFTQCRIPAQYDPNQTPIIIKFEVTEGGGFSTEINSALFPSITGTEFSFSSTGGTGTWTYTPGAGDPAINFFVAKGGPNFNLFSNLGAANSDSWLTPLNPANGQRFGLSHLSFYDTQGPGETPGGKVAEPVTLGLLGLGLLGLAAVRRRKS
jgi:hypothetical protein